MRLGVLVTAVIQSISESFRMHKTVQSPIPDRATVVTGLPAIHTGACWRRRSLFCGKGQPPEVMLGSNFFERVHFYSIEVSEQKA